MIESKPHVLTWTIFKDGDIERPIDRNREWRYGPYGLNFFRPAGYSCSVTNVERVTMKVKYQGSAPINTEILTRHYERVFPETCNPSFYYFCCFVTFPYIIYKECTGDSAETKQENARLLNLFVADTLREADQEVEKRLAAVSGIAKQVLVQPPSQQRQLEDEVAQLKTQLLAKQKMELLSQLGK